MNKEEEEEEKEEEIEKEEEEEEEEEEEKRKKRKEEEEGREIIDKHEHRKHQGGLKRLRASVCPSNGTKLFSTDENLFSS